MIGKGVKIKELDKESIYYKAHESSHCKGDRACNIYGKSEQSEVVEFWWDSVKKECVPWRGGVVVTSKHTFSFCAHHVFWNRSPKKLLNYLIHSDTIEKDDKTILYFWKD